MSPIFSPAMLVTFWPIILLTSICDGFAVTVEALSLVSALQLGPVAARIAAPASAQVLSRIDRFIAFLQTYPLAETHRLWTGNASLPSPVPRGDYGCSSCS